MKKKIPLSGHGTVQRDIMKMRISIYSKAVYCLLMTYKGDKNACYPSMRTISDDLKISRSTVIRSISELEENNLLYVRRGKKKNGDNEVNTYIPDVLYEYVEVDRGGSPQTLGGPPQTPPLVSDVDHKNNIIKNNIEEKEIYKKFLPPTLNDVIDYFLAKGYKKEVAEKAFDYYDTAGWKDSKGKKIINWKQKMIGVWFKEENKDKSKQDQEPELKFY